MSYGSVKWRLRRNECRSGLVVRPVQNARRHAGLVSDGLSRQDETPWPAEEETLAQQRTDDVGVAEAGGIAPRDDGPADVKVVAVRVRHAVDRDRAVLSRRIRERALARHRLQERQR